MITREKWSWCELSPKEADHLCEAVQAAGLSYLDNRKAPWHEPDATMIVVFVRLPGTVGYPIQFSRRSPGFRIDYYNDTTLPEIFQALGLHRHPLDP